MTRRKFFAGFAGVLSALGIGAAAARQTNGETVLTAEEVAKLKEIAGGEPQVLRLRDDDVVIFKSDRVISYEACRRFEEEIQKHLPAKCKAILVGGVAVDAVVRSDARCR